MSEVKEQPVPVQQEITCGVLWAGPFLSQREGAGKQVPFPQETLGTVRVPSGPSLSCPPSRSQPLQSCTPVCVTWDLGLKVTSLACSSDPN